MNKILLKDIPASGYFTKAVYLDENFILAAPEMLIDSKLISVVTEWGFSEIFSDGIPCDHSVPDETTQSKKILSANHSSIFDQEKIQQAIKFYSEIQYFAESLYKQNSFDYSLLTEPVRQICNYIRDNRIYLMRVFYNIEPKNDDDFIILHTVRTTVIAIVIGIFLKLPQHRLMDLGIAALLHEIGMVKLPHKVYLDSQELTENDKKLIYSHPIIGYKIMKASNFPLEVSLAVLEHHERENGKGYPQGLIGQNLTLYSKIISVACSFEAIISNRPHREAKDGHIGMIEFLKNEGKQYNDIIIKAFIYSLSLYPIGMMVLLSNDKKAQVINVDSEDPRYPIVEILDDVLLDSKSRVLQTSEYGVSIIRPLSREEIDEIK